MSKLSIIIPVYNEAKTIRSVIASVSAVDLGGIEKEIIIVDDHSTDGTRDALRSLVGSDIRTHFHDRNRGKGAAIRNGFAMATGDYLVVQDADLEYDPHDFPRLLQPLIEGRADVVYGSRFLGDRPRPVARYWHAVGNHVITMWSNMCTNRKFTDVATCYKAYTKNAMVAILPRLTAERFEIEVDLTAQAVRLGLRMYEVSIAYAGRSYAEGKKIGWKDGVAFLWAIAKYNVIRPSFHGRRSR